MRGRFEPDVRLHKRNKKKKKKAKMPVIDISVMNPSCVFAEESAMGEPAWEGAGKELGLQIWRIVVSGFNQSGNPGLFISSSSWSASGIATKTRLKLVG